MSRDHILSAAVLRSMSSGKVVLEGHDFSRVHAISSDALQTKSLCRRHNSALGPLDAEAGRLFRAVHAVESSFAAGSFTQNLHFFAGLDIERWLAKTMVNVFRAKLTRVRAETHCMPAHVSELFDGMMSSPFGLYVPVPRNAAPPVAMQIAPLTRIGLITSGTTVAGLAINLAGLELRLVVAGTEHDLALFQAEHELRPKFLNFHDGRSVVSIAFAWPGGSGNEIWLSRGSASMPVPTGSNRPPR